MHEKMTTNVETDIDKVNTHTMKSVVQSYDDLHSLELNEQTALDSIRAIVKNKPILDLGVGGGRTVSQLQAISEDYIGIDYVKEMVECCQRKNPGMKFEQGDARNLSRFDNDTFALVMFSWGGISMVDHSGRIAILNEVHRVLQPGGFFLFSTYNSKSQEYKKLFAFPPFSLSPNPIKLTVGGIKYITDVTLRVVNRIRYKRLEEISPEYSIINDICHNYSTMLYYISLKNQIKQLSEIGFKEKVDTYDCKGKITDHKTMDDSILYLARK